MLVIAFSYARKTCASPATSLLVVLALLTVLSVVWSVGSEGAWAGGEEELGRKLL